MIKLNHVCKDSFHAKIIVQIVTMTTDERSCLMKDHDEFNSRYLMFFKICLIYVTLSISKTILIKFWI